MRIIKSFGFAVIASLIFGGIFDGLGAFAALSKGSSLRSSLCLTNWTNIGCDRLLGVYVIMFVFFFLLALVRFGRKG